LPHADLPIEPVSGRECGDCGLCCKLLAVDEIGKPSHRWCAHFEPHHGCAIYETRPAACAAFQCLWLKQDELGPDWQPNRARFVLYFDSEGTQLVVNVDPAQAKAWRQEPYFSTLRDWARHGVENGVQVVIKIGQRIIALLPDREIDLGEIADGERIRFSRVRTPEGIGLVAEKVPASD
jgi:hypothetical protein